MIPNWFNLTPANPISSSGIALSYSELREISFILLSKSSSSLVNFNSDDLKTYLETQNLSDIQINQTQPTIEDTFMELAK